MKTRTEVLSNMTNEHDRKLAEESMNKFDKFHNKAKILMIIASAFALIGIIGIQFYPPIILSLIPVFPLMFIALILNIKGSGII